MKGGRCDGLNFRLVVPCGLIDGHDGPHLGIVSDGRARCRAAWEDNYGTTWRTGRTWQNRTVFGTVLPPAKRGSVTHA